MVRDNRKVGHHVPDVKDRVEKISGLYVSVRQEWIDWLVRGGVTREQIAAASGVTERTVSRWRSDKEAYEPDDGQVFMIVKALDVDPPSDMDIMSREIDPDALRNAGVIVRNAKTGKVWFVIRFPAYMPVINPYVIEVEEPSTDYSEPETVEEGEDVAV